MPQSLPELFQIRAKAILEQHPALRHEWSTYDDQSVGLKFPAQSDSGYDVELLASRDEVTVLTDGAHVHCSCMSPDSPAQVVDEALGLVRDLLSPVMRLRTVQAGQRPYRWYLEMYDGPGWRREHSTALLFWNYLARRSESVRQNEQLPAREPRESG